MQGACLFLIYLTLQAGLVVRFTPKPMPDGNTGDALLVALGVANIIVLVSPVVMGLVAALQVLPESIRRRVSAFFTGPPVVLETAEPAAAEPAKPGHAPDAAGWESADVPPVLDVADQDVAAAAEGDATHIELVALSADAWQPADLDAWRGNAMFGRAYPLALATDAAETGPPGPSSTGLGQPDTPAPPQR